LFELDEIVLLIQLKRAAENFSAALYVLVNDSGFKYIQKKSFFRIFLRKILIFIDIHNQE